MSLTEPLQEKPEDESFVILESSIAPDVNSDTLIASNFNGESLQEMLENQPFFSNLMVASRTLSEDPPSSDSGYRITELMEENALLRETLKRNNVSIKDQFDAIARWREDVMETHRLHKEKFAETKDLIENLKSENSQLKSELENNKNNSIFVKPVELNNLYGSAVPKTDSMIGGSFQYFVDDSTVDKITEQLSLVEKERRMVMEENEKLNWQKESLEKIVNSLKDEINEVKSQSECFDQKISTLQTELKEAQVKLLQSENVKVEFSQFKQQSQEIIKKLNLDVRDLRSKLREAYTVAFLPLRYTIEVQNECNQSTIQKFMENVTDYDRILKELSADLNHYTNEFCNLMENVSSLNDAMLSRLPSSFSTTVKEELCAIKNTLENHHKGTALHNHHTKSAITSMEKMFSDYRTVLNAWNEKHSENKQLTDKVDKLNKKNHVKSSEIFIKKEEITSLNNEINKLQKIIQGFQNESDECEILKVQLDVYKNDFETERKARSEIAAEKQQLLDNLRGLQIRNQLLNDEIGDLHRAQGVNRNSQHRRSNEESAESMQPDFFCCPLCKEPFDSADKLELHVNLCLDKIV